MKNGMMILMGDYNEVFGAAKLGVVIVLLVAVFGGIGGWQLIQYFNRKNNGQ